LKSKPGTCDGAKPIAKGAAEKFRQGAGGVGSHSYRNDFVTLAFQSLRRRDGLGHVASTIPLHGKHDLHCILVREFMV
jgi:hypothetical protein